jgi:transposase
MKSRIVSIDLAKDVFEIALADGEYRILERRRLSRGQFQRFLQGQAPARVLLESCGTAHYWGRYAEGCGHTVKIIPAQYVKPYRRRSKTDRADCEALLEADRCGGIQAVPIRSIGQQQVQQLHRLREQYKRTRTSRINMLRGFLRELGHPLALQPATVMKRVPELLEQEEFPVALKQAFRECLEEIESLVEKMKQVERELQELSRQDPAMQRVRQIGGIGLLTSTALVAEAGSPDHFKNGRYFAAWLGLTPREFSSGNNRFLGRISKRGDTYLRMLLIHGARSLLARAHQLPAGQCSRLQRWALQLEQRAGHNKATVALANKLARTVWAVWKHERDFDGEYAQKYLAM